jgi:sirohydrochlorin cobaltochelatase
VTSVSHFGQLEIREGATGRVIGVPGDQRRCITATPAALRAFVRSDELGRYRPLSGARNLPSGWEVACDGSISLDDALDVVYPLGRVHQCQFAAGSLEIRPLEEVLGRQSGRYEGSDALSPAGRAAAVATVCGDCVRKPVWAKVASAPDDIPCPEPCSVMVAFCREAALWEQEPPVFANANPGVAYAAFDEPGNELRETYLRSRASA